MRKGISAAMKANTLLSAKALDKLQQKGFRFVQVMGLTMDKHFDYMEPSFMLLVPMRELPTNPLDRDIYEPTDSELLYQWAAEKDGHLQVFIASPQLN
jgi:hypothetical protein